VGDVFGRQDHAVDQGGHRYEDGSITDELSASMKKGLAVGCTDDGVIGQEKPMSFPTLLL
jgi:hypothetical protein